MEAALEPQRVRADLRFLWPDLHRAGRALRLPADTVVLAAPSDAASVCERIETELAATAWRYRRVLVSGLAAAVMPAAVLALVWWASGYLPSLYWFDPFTRGYLFSGPSFYEAVAFTLLAAIIVWGQMKAGESWRSLRRLGTDYRRLRSAKDSDLSDIAEEASSGRWPRVEALLRQGREFGAYRTLMDATVPQ